VPLKLRVDNYMPMLKGAMTIMELDIPWVEETLKEQGDFFLEYNTKFISDEDRHDINNYSRIVRGYIELLIYLKTNHPEEFSEMPKGYPYYWIGFLLFKTKVYEQAIFFLDAAVFEDKKYMREINDKGIIGWRRSGAAAFFMLHEYKKSDETDFTFFNLPELKGEVEKLIGKFNANNRERFKLDFEKDYLEEFTSKLLGSRNTALITTLYSFIMEKNDIDNLIKLRSTNGGTVEPMILHLLKGSVLFESLIKVEYHDKIRAGKIIRKAAKEDISVDDIDVGSIHVTISDILQDENFKKNMGYKGIVKSSISDIGKISIPPNCFTIKQSFGCVAKIRNTTAHNLCWDDLFIKNYDKLYLHIIYSIFYYIYRQYVHVI